MNYELYESGYMERSGVGGIQEYGTNTGTTTEICMQLGVNETILMSRSRMGRVRKIRMKRQDEIRVL